MDASTPHRVLVVDDSVVDRKLAANMLEKAGHIVSVAASGEAALAALQESTVDLVLLDVNMHGLSGFDVLTALKQRAHTRDIPIVMMSSDQGEKRIVRCVGGRRRCGASAAAYSRPHARREVPALTPRSSGRFRSAPPSRPSRPFLAAGASSWARWTLS